jgi:hypothetical protein
MDSIRPACMCRGRKKQTAFPFEHRIYGSIRLFWRHNGRLCYQYGHRICFVNHAHVERHFTGIIRCYQHFALFGTVNTDVLCCSKIGTFLGENGCPKKRLLINFQKPAAFSKTIIEQILKACLLFKIADGLLKEKK